MAPSDSSFSSLGISSWLIEALQSLSISSPSEIQRECIRPILDGKNVIGSAQTGSGKTLAFGLPILQKLSEDPYGVFAIILTPTRELAFQIAEQLRALGTGIGLRECVVVGGMDMMTQALHLSGRPHIVIATPGRLVDHIQSSAHAVHFSRVKFLVLDEADRLLHPTFATELETIFEKLPKSRQTLLFSATMTKSIEKLIENAKEETEVENSNLFVYRSNTKYAPVDRLDQRYLFVPSTVREAFLIHLLRNEFKGKHMIIFTSRCRTCALLLVLLQSFGLRSTALHSMMSQSERIASLAKFKSNIVPILLATDVGSRGLDIPTVQLVINFDIPNCATDYIHRVGRTARAGRGGMSLSIVTERDVECVLNVEKKMDKKLEKFEGVDEDEINKAEFLNEVNVAKREALMVC
ncbi:P-loop containing nucleoside triphosphate hydrolase protein [Paraphysoderma sedebokerense]|nr:P-loop containing nucleoside triphosphate hydrolase protein [Paraphysoderma sedebokerense]KAI9137852.1 P-loop containing nucleoside triphosphate hydrolase protein [Paraphysoderma sedebokerense]